MNEAPNDCSRCHERPGILWAIWPNIGKVWLCEPCGEVQRSEAAFEENSKRRKNVTKKQASVINKIMSEDLFGK